MTVSLKPVSHGSGGIGVGARNDLNGPVSFVDKDRLAVDDLEEHLVDVHGVGVNGGVVELPDFSAPTAGFSVTGSIPFEWRPNAGPGVGIAGDCAQPGLGRRIGEELRHLFEQGQRAGTFHRRSGVIAGNWRNCGGVVGSAASAGTTRNCITWPVVVGSATGKSMPGTPPPNGSSGPTIAEDVVAQRHIGEVNDHVGALGRTHEQLAAVERRHIDWRGQEATLVADLPYLHAGDVAEIQDQEARVAAIEEAETIAPLFDIEEGPGVAIDHDAVAEELGVPDRRDIGVWDVRPSDAIEEGARVRIEERAVAVEGAILDGDRDLVVGLVGRELVVFFGARGRAAQPPCQCAMSITAVTRAAADDEEAGRTGIDVESRHAQRMVVIPHGRSPVRVRVLEDGVAGSPSDRAGRR